MPMIAKTSVLCSFVLTSVFGASSEEASQEVSPRSILKKPDSPRSPEKSVSFPELPPLEESPKPIATITKSNSFYGNLAALAGSQDDTH